MQIDKVNIFGQMIRKMDYLTTRHQILAQNVAHADTPKMKARDLKPFSQALAAAGGGALAQTDSRHLSNASASVKYREDRAFNGWELSPNDNDIVLEEEMIKSTDVVRDYQLMSSLLQKHLSMLRLSLQTRT